MTLAPSEAFEELAQLVHDQHRLASGVDSWRDCQHQPCYRARRLAGNTMSTPDSGLADVARERRSSIHALSSGVKSRRPSAQA